MIDEHGGRNDREEYDDRCDDDAYMEGVGECCRNIVVEQLREMG